MYVVITGASSGIGRELAYLYAKDGNSLVLVARGEVRLKELAEDLRKFDVDVLVKPYDLSQIDNCKKLISEIIGMDILLFINNAGYGNLGYFQDTNLDLEMNMLGLNINAVHVLTKLYLQNFDKGDIVNISSMAAFLPTPTFATYAATKAFVNNLSRAINYELKMRKSNIRVITVNPGPVKTNFNERAKANINRGMEVKKCARIIYSGIKKRKSVIIPGFWMKLTYFLTKLVPVGLLLKASYKIQQKK